MTDLEKVQRNGYAIKYIAYPSEEVQFVAVQQAGYAIRYIDTPFIEVQSVAVQQNGWAIRYIDNTSEAVIRAAEEAKAR
jgi:hypothetical protein